MNVSGVTKQAIHAIGAARIAVALAAVGAIALALGQLMRADAGLRVETAAVGATPVTITRPASEAPAPAVVIAHGFSGSRPLMRAFSATLARNGYVAVSFDFLGHGRNPGPMTGDVTTEDGATAALVAELGRVADFARALPGVDGRLAVLGHSMAGDVIARYALATPAVAATVGVSMFSPVVDADQPRNLLMIVGAWEAGLTDEAVRVLRLSAGPGADAGETHGDFSRGTARRAVFAPGVEHISVLWSVTALRESVDWLNATFDRPGPAQVAPRGGWVALLLAGIVALGWPLARLLPRLDGGAPGAGMRGWRFAVAALAPALLAPLIATALDWRFLPVIVGDYLALHFALYGALTALALWWAGARRPAGLFSAGRWLAALAVAGFAIGALGWALDAHVSSFRPVAARWPLILALLAGMAPYFLADEWLTRGRDAPPLAYPLTKLCFLGSLAAAVALDLERLFFLIILTPALLLFFLVYGLFSRWAWRRTGDPWVGALANAAAFAWAIGVTFPMVAG